MAKLPEFESRAIVPVETESENELSLRLRAVISPLLCLRWEMGFVLDLQMLGGSL